VAARLDTIHIASSVSLSMSLEQIATFGRSVSYPFDYLVANDAM